nr:protein LYK5-like [Ipomoea batatas]
MEGFHFLLILILNATIFAPYTSAQQKYLGNAVLNCNRSNETVPSSAVLYTCTAHHHLPACKAFLIFRSQPPPYNSVSSISNLLSADPGEVSRINNVSREAILPLNKELIVPVNCSCSCSGLFYQANTSYVIPSGGTTYFTTANNTFPGLSSSSALLRENVYRPEDLVPGMNLTVPLRCACPSRKQTENGVKFLVSYLVIWGDDVSSISDQFGVSKTRVANANGISAEDTLFPFTTLLIPLQLEPSKSQTKIYKAAAAETDSPKLGKHKRSYKSIWIGIGAGISLAILCFTVFIFFLPPRKRGKTDDQALGKAENGKAKWELPENVRDQFPAIYEFEELEKATENFSLEKRLSSSVYAGILGGKLSVIKAVNEDDASSEVEILSKINHCNVIRLRGMCEHLGVSYLVFEFMANGSLKEWLLQNDGPEVHSWNNRIRIALDVADGLNYIHNFTDPPCVHNNINSGSILLNEHLRAKIADFSLARTSQNGTGNLCPKTDVYAFGVVLLELITRREAIFNQGGEEEVMLFERVVQIIQGRNGEGEIQCVLDPRLQVKHPLGFIIDQTELALRLMKLSAACLAHEPAKRPTAAEVVSSLMSIQSDVQNLEAWSM